MGREIRGRERLNDLLGSVSGLELRGAELDPEVTVRAEPAELGLHGKSGGEQTQHCAQRSHPPMLMPLPDAHDPSLPPVKIRRKLTVFVAFL